MRDDAETFEIEFEGDGFHAYARAVFDGEPGELLPPARTHTKFLGISPETDEAEQRWGNSLNPEAPQK